MNLDIHAKKIDKAIIEKVVMYSINKLQLNRLRKLNIKIICKPNQEMHGWVTQDEPREFTIGVASNYNTIRDFVGTIAHEMTHIKQYIRNESSEEEEQLADLWAEKIATDMWEKNLMRKR